jgi:integrase
VRHPKKIVTLQPEQIQRLLIAAEGNRNAFLFHLALITGLREGEIIGLKWSDLDLTFPTTIGIPRDLHNLLKSFKEVLGKAGLPDMRCHDLRHTSVTLILNDIGAPIKEAQHRAGHASPSTTIKIYGGETTSKLDEVVARNLDELITPVSFKLHPNCTQKRKPIQKIGLQTSACGGQA